MAGERIQMPDGTFCFIDYADGEGQAVVNGRVWRWEFHEYCGPTFLRADGEPRKCQCPTVEAVWRAFEKWHRAYEKAKKVPENRREVEEVLKL